MQDSKEFEEVVIAEQTVLDILHNGEMAAVERLPYSSNYNLLVRVRSAEHNSAQEYSAVYKPRRGENPLWDFTSGTLCQREVAAYLVNTMLGWSLIPPTVLRDGPYGIGSVQLYIEHDDAQHYFTVQEDARYAEAFRQIALFDFITNNADRKSGHCLIDRSGYLWAIDHGICFHEEYKLRTVIWEFGGQPIEAHLLQDMTQFYDVLLNTPTESTMPLAVEPYDKLANNDLRFARKLAQLLSLAEQSAMIERTAQLLDKPIYPEPLSDRRNYPWPPV